MKTADADEVTDIFSHGPVTVPRGHARQSGFQTFPANVEPGTTMAAGNGGTDACDWLRGHGFQARKPRAGALGMRPGMTGEGQR